MDRKKILITGASKGLGLALAKKLSTEYELVLHASKPESFKYIEPGSHILCADFTDAEQLGNFCKKLRREHGDTLYAVINNAGLTLDKPLNYACLNSFISTATTLQYIRMIHRLSTFLHNTHPIHANTFTTHLHRK